MFQGVSGKSLRVSGGFQKILRERGIFRESHEDSGGVQRPFKLSGRFNEFSDVLWGFLRRLRGIGDVIMFQRD